MTATTQREPGRCYVGVDVEAKKVQSIAIYEEDVLAHATVTYVIAAKLTEEGFILLPDDDTPAGEAATEAVLADQGAGLGWTFVTECGYCGGHTTDTTTCSVCGIKP